MPVSLYPYQRGELLLRIEAAEATGDERRAFALLGDIERLVRWWRAGTGGRAPCGWARFDARLAGRGA